jgi:spermidine synthase
MFLVAGAGLLLEISYTRIFSFKFFYYYTYLIIGLALLGIGAGGVAVALSPKLREAKLSTVVGWCSGLAALLTAVGYMVVAWTPVTVGNIWQYGTGTSFKNLALLVVVCLALFAPFAMVGVIISTFFGRESQGIGRLYFADLIGAGLACGAVVFMIRYLGPPRSIMIAGLILAGVSLARFLPGRSPKQIVPSAVVAAVLVVGVVAINAVHIIPDSGKATPDSDEVEESRWSPIFRVDSLDVGANVVLYHDGLIGSSIHEWDGELASLDDKYIADARSLPFAVLDDSFEDEDGPGNVVIVGAAGGNEILSSLAFRAEHIDAIELNPVTHSLLLNEYAEYSGRVAYEPNVNYELGDGRSFVERSDKEFDLVWFPAPDSYAASNAASSGAFVLSESYLYTADAIEASLDKLSDTGIVATQFGEFDYDQRPYRTARYVSTARKALEDLGVEDPSDHIMVATSPTAVGATVYSTILVKATPFTDEEIARFESQVEFMAAAVSDDNLLQGVDLRHVPGQENDGTPVSQILTLPDDELERFYDDFEYDVTPITDDGPYFWNFARPSNVIRDMGESLDPIETLDPESGIGERVLLLLLAIAAVFALAFLILPFLAIRGDWKQLPRKPVSALYFACLGMGFLFFEITLIQRLTLFLGYPTYSLTVTLASVLIFTGVGALLSEKVVHRGWTVGLWLLGALAILTVFYEIGLPELVDATFGLSLALRVVIAFLIMAPLGLCLGMFMPLGLGAVGRMTTLSREYVAWGWAVNGFASVMGSVLTTLLSMTFGFRVVMAIAFCVYVVAVIALRSLMTSADAIVAAGGPMGPGADATEDEPDASPAGGSTGQPVPVAP